MRESEDDLVTLEPLQCLYICKSFEGVLDTSSIWPTISPDRHVALVLQLLELEFY